MKRVLVIGLLIGLRLAAQSPPHGVDHRSTRPPSLSPYQTLDSLLQRIVASEETGPRNRAFERLRRFCGEWQEYVALYPRLGTKLSLEEATALKDRAIAVLLATYIRTREKKLPPPAVDWRGLVPSEASAKRIAGFWDRPDFLVRVAVLTLTAHPDYSEGTRRWLAEHARSLMAHDRAPVVRDAAIEALGRLGVASPEVLQTLAAGLRRTETESRSLIALGELGERGAPVAPLLQKEMIGLGGDVLADAFRVLSRVDLHGPRTRELALQIFNDPDEARPAREAAFHLLRRTGALPARHPPGSEVFFADARRLDERMRDAVAEMRGTEIDRLLEAGAVLRENDEYQAAQLLLGNGRLVALRRMLRSSGLLPSQIGALANQAIHLDSREGVDIALDAGASFEPEYVSPPAFTAAEVGNLRLLRHLLDRGAKVPVKAIFPALSRGNLQVAMFLRGHGAELTVGTAREAMRWAYRLDSTDRAGLRAFFVKSWPEAATPEFLAELESIKPPK